MAYKKQNFKNNSTVLTAEMMEHIEEGIASAHKAMEDIRTLLTNSIGRARIGYVTLPANGWVGTNSPYSQIVNINGVTEYSQVDITPSVEQLTIFHEKDIAFVAENEDGVVTVYAVGQKPENDYTLQVTITEVQV